MVCNKQGKRQKIETFDGKLFSKYTESSAASVILSWLKQHTNLEKLQVWAFLNKT